MTTSSRHEQFFLLSAACSNCLQAGRGCYSSDVSDILIEIGTDHE